MVGLLFMFEDEKDADIVYVGRIFVDALQYRKGYGKEIMQQIEKVDVKKPYPSIGNFGLKPKDEFFLSEVWI